MAPRFVDLFAGIGGFSCGLEMAGYQCTAAIEIDPAVAELFAQNHGQNGSSPATLCGDIAAFTSEALQSATGLDIGELDLLVGGPPCQGFSTIGKRKVDDGRNKLVFEYVRVLTAFRPQAFILENVPGLESFAQGKVLGQLLSLCREAGYANVKYSVVDATTCGVPQRRRRIVLYGSRTGSLPDLGDGRQTRSPATVEQALSGLPDPWETLRRHPKGTPAPYRRGRHSDYARGLRGGQPLVTRWEPVRHTASIQSAYSALGPGETDPLTKCFRLAPDRPARTLRAGCKGRTACRPVHPHQDRVITVREAARLQSFPDTWLFPNTTSGAHRAIGNAVPPLMAKSIGMRLLEVLA